MSVSSSSAKSRPKKGNRGGRSLPQAGISQAATPPENVWLPFIRDTYPNLLTQTYFLPPLHFNKAPFSVEDIAGQKVRVLENPSLSRPQPLQPTPPPPSPQVAGTVFTENTPTLEPLRIQDSDRQDDEAQRQSLQYLQDVCGSSPQVMMVLSQLKFRQYLDKKSCAHGQTNPLYAAAISQLPSVKPLPVKIARGECDILVIHRYHSFILGEVKSVGGNQYFACCTVAEQDKLIVDKVKRAVSQLNNQEIALTQLVSDMNDVRIKNGVAPITIIKTLMLPNITSGQLRHALATNAQLERDLCQCLDSADVSQALSRCLCSDQTTQPSTWWHNTVLTRTPDPHMTDVQYERLVARFCGPATTVEIATPSPPRKVIRTWGEAVAETGLRFSNLALTPNQVSLLNRLNPEPQLMYLQGPPGCGKTVVLALKALQWLNQGKTVCVVSIADDGRAVSTLVQYQLISSFRAAAAASACIHSLQYKFEDNPGDVSRAVSDLMAIDPSCAVLIDEVSYAVRDHFKDFVLQVSTQAPCMSVWASSIWCLDHESSQPRPAQLHVETLRVSLRCPPRVTNEIKQSEDIDDNSVPCYADPAQPLTTEGPSVKWLSHHDVPGHAGYADEFDDGPLLCTTCADNIAGILSELRVGQQASSLEYRDVLILCNNGADQSDNDEMIQHLRQHHSIPLVVMTRPLSDAHARELALATTDQVIVTDCSAAAGLERRVVIGLGWGSMGPGRSLIMSRCTAYLCFIDPSDQ